MSYSKSKEISTCLWGKYNVHFKANEDVNIIVGINASDFEKAIKVIYDMFILSE